MRPRSLFCFVLLFLLGMTTQTAHAANVGITIKDTPNGNVFLAPGGGFPCIKGHVTNLSGANPVYLTGATVTGVTLAASDCSVTPLVNALVVNGYPQNMNSGYSIKIDAGKTLTCGDASGGQAGPPGLLGLDDTNNASSTLTGTITLYGGDNPTDHNVIGTSGFTLTRQYLSVQATASTPFPYRGGIVAVTGSISNPNQNGESVSILSFTLPLPPNVQLVSQLPSFANDGGVLLASPEARTYGQGHPLFYLKIPPGTPSFKTQLTLYGSSTGLLNFVGASGDIEFKTTGTGVSAWGDNFFGQLGNGTNNNLVTPTSLANLTDVVAIAGGGYHSLAVRANGAVWAWGSNTNGQLGDGTTNDSSLPIPSGLPDAVAVACGSFHSLALKSDGTVWAWGANFNGQLGNGTTSDFFTPNPFPGIVSNLTNVIAIAAGDRHNLALKPDGTVWAWGSNANGQLGDGTTTGRLTPVMVIGLSDVIGIANTTGSSSLALKSDGTVWAWGANRNGQLGDGTTTDRSTPVMVKGLTNVIAIASGAYHNLALRADSTVWAWGANFAGQLGDGTTFDHATPFQVNGLPSIVAISCGAFHSLALTSNGTVWAWGDNANNQLGDGTTTPHSTPMPVQSATVTAALASGSDYNFALQSPNTIATLSGNITLDGISDSATKQAVFFEFAPTNGLPAFMDSTLVGPDGIFRVPYLPSTSYSVRIKGRKWLAVRITANLLQGDVSDVNVTLPAGDATNDNVVDFDDLTLLAIAYNTAIGDALYDDRADFNCDGQVEFADLTLLAINYNLSGDL